MDHPLFTQLKFTRTEFQRALAGLTDQDARKSIDPMNCISWIVGHLAAQEQRNWLTRMQGITPLPELEQLYGYGSPPSSPVLEQVWSAWHTILRDCDAYLARLTTKELSSPSLIAGTPTIYNQGTVLYRQIYHYWYHIGECLAIRQLLGHRDLPEFVGDIHSHAPYQPH